MPRGYPFPLMVKRELFDLVCSGVPVMPASRRIGVSHQIGWRWWSQAGGMRLTKGKGARGLAEPGNLGAPGGRGHRLSYEERVTIMRGLDQGLRQIDIAGQIGRHPSVVSREIRRNSNRDGDYHAGLAHARAAQQAKRPKEFTLTDQRLCAAIEDWMDDGWSPKLIAQMLARQCGDDKLATVSHETIYKCRMCRPAATCVLICTSACRLDVRRASPAAAPTVGAGSTAAARNSPSVSVPPKLPTEPCPATGKVI